MRKLLAVGALALGLAAQSASAKLIVYEPFNYTPVGGNLGAVAGTIWTPSTTGTVDDTIVSGSVTPAYTSLFFPSAGNSVNIPNSSGGKIERVSTGASPISSGTLYYSILFRVTNLTGAATGATGSFVAGFNNSAGTAVSTISQAGTRLAIRKSSTDGTKFNFGVQNDTITAGPQSPRNFETTDRNVNETYLVVGEYQFNQSSNSDDVASLWINPNEGKFGADEADVPAPMLTSTGGDISQLQIASFFLRQNASAPQGITVDELRIGTTWADVVPEPGSIGLIAGASLMGLGRRKRA